MRWLYYIVQRKYEEAEMWKYTFVLDGTHTTKLDKIGPAFTSKC